MQKTSRVKETGILTTPLLICGIELRPLPYRSGVLARSHFMGDKNNLRSERSLQEGAA
jgi:hypothetical protein